MLPGWFEACFLSHYDHSFGGNSAKLLLLEDFTGKQFGSFSAAHNFSLFTYYFSAYFVGLIDIIVIVEIQHSNCKHMHYSPH